MMRDRMTDYLPLAIQLLTWFSLLYLSVLLNVSYAAANFTINGFSPSQGQVQGVVGPDGTAWLTLQTAELKATPVTLTLTKFRDKRSESIVVGFQKDNGENGDLDILKTIVTQRKATINGRHTIKLDASAAIAGREYIGEISVATVNKTIEVFPILLTRELALPIIYQTIPTGAKEVNVNVPVAGITSIRFDAGSDEYLGKVASFELGAFVSETDGRVVDVYFKDATRNVDKVTELRVPLDELRHRVTLDASQILFDNTYVGELYVSIDGRIFPPTTLKFTRHATARDAKMVVGQPSPIELLCWFAPCTPEDPIVIDVWEQSGKRPITGFTLTTVSHEGIEGYLDPLSYLSVKFLQPSSRKEMISEQSQQSVDLWRLDSSNAMDLQTRSIAAGSQGKLEISFKKGMLPGEYKIPFQVRALNVGSTESPQLVLGVSIKRPELYPLLVLFFSVLISYVLTKIIRTQLQRIELKKRISRIMDANWFRRDWSIMPVVRTKALLAQITKALDHSRLSKYLFFPSSLTEHVTSVEQRLPHLKRLCELIDYWEKSGHDILVRRRAKKVLGYVVDAFVDTPLHTDLDVSVISRLENLEEWKDPAKLVGHYWLSLKGDIMLLQSQVRLSDYAFDFEFKESHIVLNEFLSTQKKEYFAKTLTALQKYQHGLGQQITTELEEAISGTSNMLVIQPSSLEIIVQAFMMVDKTLNEIDNNGPMPVMEAVKTARDHVSNSALVNGWPYLEQLNTIIETSPSLGDEQSREVLLGLLRKITCWEPEKLNNTVGCIQNELDQSQYSDRETARLLNSELKPDDQPKNLKEAIDREIFYAKLKVINNAKDDLRMSLLSAERDNCSLQELFSIVDGDAWKKLQNSVSVEVKADQKAAFDPIDFNILTTDDDVRNSYLYKHGAIYEWEILYEATTARDRQTLPLRVKTDRPGVVQFIPMAAKIVSAKVIIRYDQLVKEVNSELSFNVGKPTMFGIVAAFQTVELVALAIALVVAVITGMQSQVYQNALSGSVAAYVALFGWGFAADQIKNLLENIRTSMGAN